MLTVLILNSLVVLSAYLTRYNKFSWGLKLSFIIIFIFLALRFNYGNDYKSYLENFAIINLYNSISIFDKSFNFEPGWLLFNRIFSSLGFFALVATIAVFHCYVYYRFIKKYVPVKYYWLAIFFYVFNPEIMLVQASAMRQSIAIALFLLSIDYLYTNKALRYILCILIASLFHGSALILIPLVFLNKFKWSVNKTGGIIIYFIFISLFIFGSSFQSELNQFISNYFTRYSVYIEGGEVTTGLGLILLSLIFGLVLYYEKDQKYHSALLFKVTIVGFMLVPLGLLVMMLARIGMYFQPIALAVYPLILVSVNKVYLKISILIFLIAFTLYTFFQFFRSEIWGESFSNYQTIFSSPIFY